MTATTATPRWRRVCSEVPGPAAIGAVVALVFRPLLDMHTLLVTPEGTTNISDMLNASLPVRLVLGHALARGHLPVWTDQFLSGYPLLANPAIGTFYPPNWLFAFLSAPAAVSLVLLLTYMLAGWFAYDYARTLGAGRFAATLGGMSFAVCGFMVSHARHMALIASACWMPLLFAQLERMGKARGPARGRAAGWLALAVAMSLLAGGVQSTYLSLLAAAVYAAVRLGGTAREPWARRLLPVGLAVAAVIWGVLLTAVQLLPARELSQLSERAAGLPYGLADLLPMPPVDLLTLASAHAASGAAEGRPGLPCVFYFYAGAPVVLLAAIGLPWSVRRRPGQVLLALGVLGAVLALGERGRLFPVAFDWVPGLSRFRAPERFGLWTEFAAAMLGALGAQVVGGWLRGHLRRPAMVALVLLTAGDLAAAQGGWNVYYPARAWLSPPRTVDAVLADGGAGDGARVGYLHSRFASRIWQGRLRPGGWQANLTELWASRALLRPSSNALWRLPSVTGYMELLPEWMASMWSGQHTYTLLEAWNNGIFASGGEGATSPAPVPAGYTEFLGAANVVYFISYRPLSSEHLQELPTGGPAYCYRNRDAFGRAYLVPEAVNAGTEAHLRALLRSGQADLRHRVYLLGASSPAATSFSALPVRARDSEDLTRVTLDFEAPAPCWLVLTDSYYPGWTARVEGKPVHVHRANGTMRAIQVPAGKHRVEFAYECRPLKTGAVVTLASAVLWLAVMLVLSRRPRAAAAPGGRERAAGLAGRSLSR